MDIRDITTWALAIYERYGLYVVFFFVFLENFPIIGLFFPALSVLIVAGFLSSGTGDTLLILVVALCGMLLADNIWYGIGRVTKGRWRWLSRRIDAEPALRRVILEQNRLILFLYPFPPYFRMFLPAAFGVLNAPLRLWIPTNLVGSTLFVSTFLFLGVAARLVLGEVQGAMRTAEVVSVSIAILCLPYLVVLYRRWRRAKRSVDPVSCNSVDAGP